MSEAKTTTDHAQIKQWVEERGGHPARVKGTDEQGTSGVLVIIRAIQERKRSKPLAGMNSSKALKKTN